MNHHPNNGGAPLAPGTRATALCGLRMKVTNKRIDCPVCRAALEALATDLHRALGSWETYRGRDAASAVSTRAALGKQLKAAQDALAQ